MRFSLPHDLQDLFAGQAAAEKVERRADRDIDAAAGNFLQRADIVIGMDAAGICDRKSCRPSATRGIKVLAEDRKQRFVRASRLAFHIDRMN